MKLQGFIVRLLIKRIIKKEGLDGLISYLPRFAEYYSSKDGVKFASTRAEVDDILRQIPELEPIKDKLIPIYHSFRDKAGLPL